MVKWLPCAVLASCLLLASCKGEGDAPAAPSPPSNPPGTPPPTTGTVIRGGERLGWDQAGASLETVQGYTFALFVDDVRNSLAEVRCATTTASSGFACSGRLPTMTPGSHTLELSAIAGGQESHRSSPFRVTVNPNASTTADTLAKVTGVAPTQTANRIACLDPGVEDCFTVHTLASGLGDVTAFAAALPGYTYFIEAGRFVRVLAGQALVPRPALVAEHEGARLVSLAVAPDFARTRQVFVGSVESSGNGAELTITRYRDVGGVLGEGAALISGLPVGADDQAPIALDAAGHIFVALPAAPDGTARLSVYAYNGHLLRFSPEGGVPAAQTSSIFAAGFARPSGLAIDASTSRGWMSGADATGASLLAMFTIDAVNQAVRIRVPSGLSPADAIGLGLVGRNDSSELWLTGRTPYRAVMRTDGSAAFEGVLSSLGEIAGVAVSDGDVLDIAARSRLVSGAPFEILRLVPRTMSAAQ